MKVFPRRDMDRKAERFQVKKNYVAGAALALALAAGGGALYMAAHPREVVLEFGMFAGSNWDVENPNSYTIIDQAIREFEEEHEGVKVHYYSGVLKDDYSEWLSRKLLEDEMPDVFMVLDDDFNLFSSMGVMKNLDGLMEKDQDFDQDAYYPITLKAGEYGGHQYALPYETAPTLMFVNKTLLEQEDIEMPSADWTWEDMYEICRKMAKDTDGDGATDQFGTYNYSWIDAAYSNGEQLFDMEGQQCYLAGAGVSDAIKFAARISDLNNGQKVSQEDFNSGNVAFTPMSFAEYRNYKTYPYKIKKYKDFQWDCITVPSAEPGKNSSVVECLLMGISNRTRHEKLAWEFLKKLTYDEGIQMNLFRYSQGLSALRHITNSREAEVIVLSNMESGASVISMETLNNVMENGIITPKFAKYQQALSLADSEISKIFDENGDIDITLKKTQRTINSYLKG